MLIGPILGADQRNDQCAPGFLVDDAFVVIAKAAARWL